MSMTENKKKKSKVAIVGGGRSVGKTLSAQIALLEELEAYRAMEARLNGISIEQVVNGFINQVEKETHEGYERGRILTNAEADDWNAYRAIGTVDEFKALKEKAEPKKIVYIANKGVKTPRCPNCNMELTMHMYKAKFCNCGQALET